ncbi:hypothetical protein [Emcibacter sp. SYSU 3D8]|uniref:hypothetical protein n=1 Tax=Emcibacter sp. SYSU 3D8 TaxID=3133969 RepID=UPI0031FE78DB
MQAARPVRLDRAATFWGACFIRGDEVERHVEIPQLHIITVQGNGLRITANDLDHQDQVYSAGSLEDSPPKPSSPHNRLLPLQPMTDCG